MILPTKHISPEASLLGIGARILADLHQPRTVTNLWERLRDDDGIVTFDRFCLAVTFLHTVNLLRLDGDVLLRASR
jgi:hypothetical protein